MLEVFFSSAFFNSVHQMVEYIIRICIYLFTLGTVVYFISMLFRLSSDTEKHDQFYHLFFVGFAAIGLATYRIWAIWLGKLFVLLARAIFDLKEGNIMTQYLGSFFGNPDAPGLQMTFLNFLSLETLSSLSYLLVMIVYEIFVIIQIIVQIFLYLLGPLAIALSLFPTLRNVFKVWLANFLAVNFWSVLIAILFRLVQTLVESPAFQGALADGDKSVLWNSFILGVIISVIIVLIPKISLAIFQGGTAAADMGSYGTGITAGVVISTVWKQLKRGGFQASQSMAVGATESAKAMAGGAPNISPLTANQNPEGGWHFDGSVIENNGGEF